MRNTNCCVCGPEQYDEELQWEKDGFRYVKCTGCGLIFVNPQMDGDEIRHIYSVGFSSKNETKRGVLDRSTYTPVLNWMERYRKINKVLDIGCFTGNFLSLAAKDGWNVYGTEISPKAADAATQKHGIDVRVGELTELGYHDEEFDIVTMFDVIEHVDDPFAYLQEVRRILRKGGAVYMNTPNIESFTHALLKSDWSAIFPWHQFYFSANTITHILKEARFSKITVHSYGFSPFSKFNPYRAVASAEKIAKKKGRLRAFIGQYPIIKRAAHSLLRIANFPFLTMSLIGVNRGATMVIRAEV